MVCEDTLKIKNLPKELTDAEKEELLKHFGASKVKIIGSKSNKKSVVYARFESKEIAREVLFRLHQTYILKSRLCVEYADQDVGLPVIRKEDTGSNAKDHFKSFISKVNSFNHSVDFQQPPPAHLKYVYPKANRATINNIGHALGTVPKFYTQVLHLMNRLNLPPPFVLDPAQVQHANKPPEPTSRPPKTSSESELESDEDSKQNAEIIPEKRKFPQKKMVKRPKFIKNPQGVPSTSKGGKSEDVFEKSEKVPIQRKIEMNVSASALSTKAMDTSDSIVGTIGNQGDCQEIPEEIKTVIDIEELASNQIPAKDLNVIAVFKNYHPGAPTNRLYVKNIAKTVELKDLEYIYNRYKSDGGEFDIRLMQEGRMKGQAFITLNNSEVAQVALKETNAFILKDKPLVVVFAKSASAKK